MSQPVQLQLSGAWHSNSRLFSDHYLDHILPGLWGSLRDEASQTMQQLQQIFAKFTPSINEAQTEEDWIKPVLHALGHTFEVQAPLKVPDGTQRPDYIFYRDEAARAAHKNKTVTAEEIAHSAFAVGDAKYWERPLDQTLRSGKSGDAFSNKNPSYQIFFYMLHSGLPWGILTNGRQWRLYNSQTAHKLEVYYEVDLPALLASNDVEIFLYFYTFFRRAAFDGGPLSLDSILTASTEYAQGVSESLRQQVYDALRFVAQGFLEYPDNHLEPTPETCKSIYDNSLILLYRLLFILYAEARDLLPLQDNASYRRKYSLDAIKKDAVSELSAGLILPTSGFFWTRLKELFKAINAGNPPLNVTNFNGGLFDPERHSFLEKYVVGDASLCRAIDKLARVNFQYVDYRDLAERHLGTIYEGLLEYTLRVATEPMVELKSSSRIVPAAGVPKRDIAAEFSPGEVYLVTDRGERKLTGSYYTPDYIVKYMVDSTVRPVLDEAVRNAQSDAERVRAVLAINVLDPSMGSGHFPVEVTEYIARYLVELGAQPEPEETGRPPLMRLAGDDTGEADLTYWKRRVAQQCIYGVDLNPLAVELAKLSLWLVTVAKDRPLSFLDHHLRTGNALIGSWLSEIAAGQHPGARSAQKRAKQQQEAQKEAGQMVLPVLDDEFRQDTSHALDSIAAIESNRGVTIKDVKAQEAAYEQLRHSFSEKYRNLANLGAALYYNLEIGSDVWRPIADYALKRHVEDAGLQQQFESWLKQANLLAEKKRFFHWELEFPNIFFDSQGQPLGDRAGFDVVIGNPPYVRQEQLSADKPFYQDRYEVYHGVADLFVYFFAQGLRLLRKDGRLAYISSNTWLYANYGTPLRQYLRTQTTIETLIDLGNNYIFADAPDLSPSIQIVCKRPPVNEYTTQAAIFAKGEGIKTFSDQLPGKLFELSIQDQLDSGWRLTSNASRVLLAKVMATGTPLKEVTEGQIYYGIKTGLNEAFIISQSVRDRLVKDDPACAAIIKPVLRGEDLRPWYQENEGRWLICLPYGWTVETFPDVKPEEMLAWEKLATRHPGLAAHLEPFAEAGRKRQDKGQFWWELRPCDYYDAFEQPKILYPDISKKPRFSWGEPGIYLGNTGYCIPTDSYALLGILSSRTLWYAIARISQPLGERAGALIYRLFRQYIERLPIPPLTGPQRSHIGNLAQQLTETARERYEVRRKTTHRIEHDLGTQNAKLNQRLSEWWQLSFAEFRGELTRIFKRDIPLKDRDDWEALLRERTAEIERLTARIIALETELNAAVYDVFGLDEAERKLIEEETKYKYGEW
ncbi:MAG TPA: Eco57I restriction-modification methylase domain-containing protein [Ktedonobacteraceae bacterium]|nr:Eco57I restriction-modification methylase domain-containing protein [Ktedonobacteraceae bacterium]